MAEPNLAEISQRAFIGVLLLDADRVWPVADRVGITAEMFSDALCRAAWEVCIDRRQAGKPIDLQFIAEALAPRDSAIPGGVAPLDKLCDTPIVEHAGGYAEEILTAYRRRRITRLARRVEVAAEEGDDNALASTLSEIDALRNADTTGESSAPVPGNALMGKDFPPVQWAFPDLLPCGLSVLAGPPKSGKSFIALDLAVAAVSGRPALDHFPVSAPGSALLIGFEDSERRWQERITSIGAAGHDVAGLDLVHMGISADWRAERKGLSRIRAWLHAHPDARFVCIDTWGRFRPRMKHGLDSYDETTAWLTPLHAIAMQANIALLLVHHSRKGQSEGTPDPFDMMHGTIALMGAVDSAFMFERARASNDGLLRRTGRDCQEAEIALGRLESGGWAYIDGGKAAFITEERRAVLSALATGPARPAELAKRLNSPAPGLRMLLSRMFGDGQLDRNRNGEYSLPQEAPISTPQAEM